MSPIAAGRPMALRWRAKRVASWPGREAELYRQLERQHHADGDAFAVQQAAGKSRRRFQGMAESMAEIEQSALAGLPFVARHDGGLHAAGMGDGLDQRLAVTAQCLGGVGFQPVEERRIAQGAIFDHFGIAGQQFAARQGREQGGVGDDDARLMEQADQVLALGRVDRGLAADRGIHLGQQGGGNLRKGDAALEHGGGEAGEIADHPAAQRHDQALAVDLHVEQRAGQFLQPCKAFAAFAGRHHDGTGVDAGLAQALQQWGEMEVRDMVVGHHRHRPARKRLQQRARLAKQAGAGMDVIGALAQSDGNDLSHGSSPGSPVHSPASVRAAMILSTAAPCGSSALSSIMSAVA